MKKFLILPTQLFKDIKILKDYDIIYLIEDTYYLNSKFHKQKLLLHVSSLNYYYDYLLDNHINVKYINFKNADYEKFLKKGDDIKMYDPIDKDIIKKLKKFNITYLETPLFINTNQELLNYKNSKGNDRFTNSDFYKLQRKKLDILMKNESTPLFNQWSFDKNNRNAFDKGYAEYDPKIYNNKYIEDGKKYITKHFKNAFGNLDKIYYPNTHKSAEAHLNDFIEYKIIDFGKYQDSISKEVIYGNHANISSLLNIGLLTPQYVIKVIMNAFNKYKNKKSIIDSVEAIVRQIIGWREYIRFMYVFYKNDILDFKDIKSNISVPASWYKGNTSLEILDHYIDKVKDYAYLHHIERLMIINNLFILYEIKFKDMYNWFMICFIDSYDWVMIPNLYMNLNALNNNIIYMSRVYLASDNYIRKMSDFKNKEDFKIINELYWKFIKKNKKILKNDYYIRSQVNRT
jgi:deoxyribodipyrimidine photolyase-related protein